MLNLTTHALCLHIFFLNLEDWEPMTHFGNSINAVITLYSVLNQWDIYNKCCKFYWFLILVTHLVYHAIVINGYSLEQPLWLFLFFTHFLPKRFKFPVSAVLVHSTHLLIFHSFSQPICSSTSAWKNSTKEFYKTTWPTGPVSVGRSDHPKRARL